MFECSPLGAGACPAWSRSAPIPPQYVKPDVKRNKTDAADAEAICEAVGRPNMRFVPIKTREQQSVLVLHRVRALLVRQRTAAVNAARGLLGEFGLVVGKGIRKVDELRGRMHKLEPELLPDEAREAIGCLFDHIEGLGERLGTVEARILAWHKSSQPETCIRARRGTHDGNGPRRCGGRWQAVPVGPALCRVAGVDATHQGEWRQGAHRPDQQRRRSLFAHPSDPRSTGSCGYHVPQGCGASAMADGPNRSAACKRRRGGGGAQDGTGVVGNAHPCRSISPSDRGSGGGVTGSALLQGGAGLRG